MAPEKRLRKVLPAILLLAMWELVGDLNWVASGALPSPSEIALRFWADRADYPGHIWATLVTSGAGFLVGNLIALAAGMLFVLLPLSARIARGLNIAIFALPPIAIAPILALTLPGIAPRVTLAALGVYFVTMQATVTGLTQFDARSGDLIRAYGGNRWALMRLVQARNALPAVLSGLRVAAPNAVLGAILAEFGSGGRKGLGTYLLGSLGRADPARLWGIGLTATVISGLSYAVFAIAASRTLGTSRAVSLDQTAPPANTGYAPIWEKAASAVLPFAIWWAVLGALQVPAMLGKSPPAVFQYLFLNDGSAVAREKLVAALAQTLPIAGLGLMAGIAFAFGLAVSARLLPSFARAFMPIALITQTMPLVALTPLLVLMLGRGTAVTLWITISVTFFPAYVMIAQGLAQVPRAALELPRAYGATPWTELRLVAIPAALPWVLVAIRMTVSRALLGVMIAEWLATGRGLGGLMNQSRGHLDYGMIWSVAVVTVLLSVALYRLAEAVEVRLFGR